jgi:hypothetical protein
VLGAIVSLALLSPAYDPRWRLEAVPAYFLAGALFVLFLEFGLLNAKIARLAKLPRAHVTQEGRTHEIALHTTASRIAASWPTSLALGIGLLGGIAALQLALAAGLPPAPGASVEARGPFGFALVGAIVLALVALFARRHARATMEPGKTRTATEAQAPAKPRA